MLVCGDAEKNEFFVLPINRVAPYSPQAAGFYSYRGELTAPFLWVPFIPFILVKLNINKAPPYVNKGGDLPIISIVSIRYIRFF